MKCMWSVLFLTINIATYEFDDDDDDDVKITIITISFGKWIEWNFKFNTVGRD